MNPKTNLKTLLGLLLQLLGAMLAFIIGLIMSPSGLFDSNPACFG